MMTRSWTQDEITRALEMRSRGMTPEKIGHALARSSKAVRTKFSWLAMSQSQRVKRNEYERARRMGQDKTLTKIAGITFEAHKSRMPEEVSSERNSRFSIAPRDLTAAFFGDPLPGYSALDRRR